MAERPERRRRPVDVVDLPVRLAARRVVAVRERHLADVARHRDRQPPARVDVAGEDLRDRGRPGVAGDPGEEDRGAVLGRPLDGRGTAADDDEHGRRAGRDDGLDELLLAAQEAEIAAVARLARGRVVGQPGALADDDDRDLGIARGRDRLRDAGVVAVAQPDASRVRDSFRDQNRSRSASRIVGIPASSSIGLMTSFAGNPNGFARWRISRSVSMWSRWA